MMGHDRSTRYELHAPMSLGDVLAALFRRKPKRARAPRSLELGQKPEIGELEPAGFLECAQVSDQNPARLLLK